MTVHLSGAPPGLRGILRDHLRARRGRAQGHPGPDRRASRRVAARGVGDDPPDDRRGPRRTSTGEITLTDGHGSGQHHGPPAPAGRAVPHRPARALVGRGPPRGRQVGTRHQPRGRGGHHRTARRPDDLSARQPDPGVRLRRTRAGAAVAAPVEVGGMVIPASPRSSSSPRDCSSSSRRTTCSPGPTASVIAMSPDGTTTVEVDGQMVGLSAFTADRILVSQRG